MEFKVLPFLLLLARCGGSAPTRRSLEKHRAHDRLVRLCEEEDYADFLECEQTEKGYNIVAGAFGAGVKAKIKKHPKIKIYRNCDMPERFSINLDSGSLEKAKEIDVFIKTAQFGMFAKVERREKRTGNLFDRERQMTHKLAPTNLSPMTYDLFDAKTDELVFSDAFVVTEFVESMNALQLSQMIGRQIASSFRRTCRSLTSLPPGSSERKYSALVHDLADDMAIRLKQHMHLVEQSFGIALELFSNGYRHCDLHGQNIIIKVTKGKRIGKNDKKNITKGYLLSPSFGDVNLAGKDLTKGKKVDAYLLSRKNVKLVDLTYLQYVGKAERNAEFTCTSLLRSEDVRELRRVVNLFAQAKVVFLQEINQAMESLSERSDKIPANALQRMQNIKNQLFRFNDDFVASVTTHSSWKKCIRATNHQHHVMIAMKTTGSALVSRLSVERRPDHCGLRSEKEAVNSVYTKVKAAAKHQYEDLAGDLIRVQPLF